MVPFSVIYLTKSLRITAAASELVIDAEAKLGERLAAIPKKYNKGLGSRGRTYTLPDGIDKKNKLGSTYSTVISSIHLERRFLS